MSDNKNEFWRELFGEDFPENIENDDTPAYKIDPSNFDLPDLPDRDEDKSGYGGEGTTNVLPTLGDLKRRNSVPASGREVTSADEEWEDNEPVGWREKRMAKARERYDRRFEKGSSDVFGEEELPTRWAEDIDEDEDVIMPLDDGGRARIVSRDRTTRRSGCLGAVMYVGFVIGISVILAALGWLAASDVLALGKPAGEIEFTVREGFTIDELAADMKDAELIKYEFLFKIFASFMDADEKIEAGTYVLNTNYDYNALVSYMRESSGAVATTTVQFIEGSTMEQMFELLEESGVCDADSLFEAAASYDYDYGFLDSSTLGDATRLEGYLFPDKYEFYVGESAISSIDRLLENFDSKVTAEMRQTAVEKGYTLADIITIASLIEKETDGTDRKNISSVIYNRLNNYSYETAGYLQIDAALYYGIDKDMTEPLTSADLAKDTPYNTYLYQGLPPTPIANPSLASIEAALDPNSTDYYYYALGKDFLHKFSRTLAEHEAFINSENYVSYSGN